MQLSPTQRTVVNIREYQMAGQTNGKCFSTIKCVCVYWKIIGLCPFVLGEDDTGPPSYGGMIYTTILTLTYPVAYYFVVMDRFKFIMVQETSMTVIGDFLGLSTEFFLAIAAWLYVTLRHEKILRILKMLRSVHEKSKTMDMGQDFQKNFETIKIHTIVINITWFILYVSDHVFLYNNGPLNQKIWVPFNFPRIVTHNIVLMYAEALWIVKKFFISLNEKILKLSKEVTERLAIPEGNREALWNDGLQSFVTQSPLEACIQMHSDLVDVTKMIVDFFALSIILVLLLHLILLASDFYIMSIIWRDRKSFDWIDVCKVTEIAGWWLLGIIETFILIAISDSTANEANRTGTVLHTMLIMDPVRRHDDLGQTISLRLLQRPLKIELYGLIEIRLSVMQKMISMIITYVTIMMQLDIQDSEIQLLGNI